MGYDVYRELESVKRELEREKNENARLRADIEMMYRTHCIVNGNDNDRFKSAAK